jgi:DNA-binding transcriptional MerR regulator
MLMEQKKEAPVDTPGDLLTGDVAKILRLSSDRVRQLERSGLLTARRTPTGTRLFDRESVLRFSRERRKA